MNTAQLVQLVSLKLGEQTAFYPTEEIVRGGLNPAQRLLCLVYPQLLTQRFVYTVFTEVPFIDLRTLRDSSNNLVGNRMRRVKRVLLGDISGDAPLLSTTTDEFTRLRPVSIQSLASQRDWMTQRGEVRKYWMWGDVWLGIYKRPVVDTTITIIFDAIPVQLSVDDLTASPSIDEVYHAVIAEIATGLLLLKEGSPQGSLGLQRVVQALNLQVQGAVA